MMPASPPHCLLTPYVIHRETMRLFDEYKAPLRAMEHFRPPVLGAISQLAWSLDDYSQKILRPAVLDAVVAYRRSLKAKKRGEE